MLAKVAARRRDGRSSFRTLMGYISRNGFGPQDRQRLTEVEDGRADPSDDASDRAQALQAVEQALVSGLPDGHPVTRAAGGVVGRSADRGAGEADEVMPAMQTNCLSLRTAAAEMKAVADMNGRVKDPVYHVVLSWREAEAPTDEQMFEAGRQAMAAVGMAEHQYLFAAHRDTANHHLHMMVNRVHPETERAVYPERDFYKLDRCMRELEVAQGWSHDEGPYAVFERDGVVVIDWTSRVVNSQEKVPAKARDMEAQGHESLFSYARGAPREAVASLFRDSQVTWQALHGVLAEHGLALREKGQGLAVHDKADPEQTPIKASDMHEALGKGRLVKRLGAFEPPIQAIEVEEPGRSYSRHREPVRASEKDSGVRPAAKTARADERGSEPRSPARSSARASSRDEAREARARARKDLHERYDAWALAQRQVRQQARAAQVHADRQRYQDLGARHKLQREQIRRSGLLAPVRKALYSVAAMEAVQAREALRSELAEQKRSNSGLAKPVPVVQGFKDWVADRAQEGDAAAISQLRGWAYADRRRAKALERAGVAQRQMDGITGVGGDDALLDPLSPQWRMRSPPVAVGVSDVSGTAGPGQSSASSSLLSRLEYQVDRQTGDVRYQVGGRHVFTDSGSRVSFSADGAEDRAALAAGLLLARQKFGPEVTLTGSDQFKG